MNLVIRNGYRESATRLPFCKGHRIHCVCCKACAVWAYSGFEFGVLGAMFGISATHEMLHHDSYILAYEKELGE